MVGDARQNVLWSLFPAVLMLSCAEVSSGTGGEGGTGGTGGVPIACTDSTGVECDDGEECTADVCDPATGKCFNPPVEEGTPCGGGDMGVPGLCQQGFCDRCLNSDGSRVICEVEECTFSECNRESGACESTPRTDGVRCVYQGGAGMCLNRACVAADPCGSDADCDDQNECTFEECDLAAERCLRLEAEDGDPCETGTCVKGECQ